MNLLLAHTGTGDRLAEVVAHVASFLQNAGVDSQRLDLETRLAPPRNRYDGYIVLAERCSPALFAFARDWRSLINGSPSAYIHVGLDAVTASADRLRAVERATRWRPAHFLATQGPTRYADACKLQRWTMRRVAERGRALHSVPLAPDFLTWDTLDDFIAMFLADQPALAA